MDDLTVTGTPDGLDAIQRDTQRVGLERSQPNQFDFIYADTWPGKFTHLERALALLRVGGFYFVDDLLPQASWPAGHAPKVPLLIEQLERQHGFVATKLAWASGLMVLVRTDAIRR